MKTILVIEDEPKMRRNLTQMLGLEGFRALAAADGTEGVTVAMRELPDLILCDITMPGMDGHAVLTALRTERATSKTPFIFLTARGDRTDLRAGMNLGADDYLIKPVTREDLLAAITARIQRAAQHGTELASPATIKKHVEHILEKLEVENRAAASLRAFDVLAQQQSGASI
jgi:DNA-binding response OmpR family regulator